MWLSADNRLLADAPHVADATLDLAGHSLVLPPDLPPDTAMPLIVVGTSATLRVRNGTIYNAASLPACLQLGAGAQLLLDGTGAAELVDGPPPHTGDPLEAVEGAPALAGLASVAAPAMAKAKQARFQVRCRGRPLPALRARQCRPLVR